MLALGLVGAPNAGKSTFFKAATLKDVKIADYPFTTIEPNEGHAFVTVPCACASLGTPCKQCHSGTRFVPVMLVDVAGLVEGASEGRGRGNAFLTDCMRAAAIIMVVDASGRTDADGNPNPSDPADAVRILDRELDIWIASLIEKDRKAPGTAMAIIAKRLSGVGITPEQVRSVITELALPEALAPWGADDLLRAAGLLRMTAKPCLIAANKADVAATKEHVARMRQDFPDRTIVACSAEVELALREAAQHGIIEYMPGQQEFKIVGQPSDKQRSALTFMAAFLANQPTNVQQILNTVVFNILKMIVVYPVENEHTFADKKGNVLPDAFLLREGSTARDLAYAVHQDIGNTFIAAIDARTKQRIGAGNVLKNGDIISVRSGR